MFKDVHCHPDNQDNFLGEDLSKPIEINDIHC